MFNTLLADFQIIFERDPAARSKLEVLLCYPGLQALLVYRMAHRLYQLRLPVMPRLLSNLGRFLTGIEIHPGATIGKGIFIDHGMGVVVGETAVIGDYSLIYQGVTLGGTGKQSGKRHPTVGRNVVVGAGAKVLGNLDIGDNVRIGAGSVVLRDVPADCTVVGVPGRIVYRSGARVNPLEHGNLPDSEAKVIRMLLDRIDILEEQVQQLQTRQSDTAALVDARIEANHALAHRDVGDSAPYHSSVRHRQTNNSPNHSSSQTPHQPERNPAEDALPLEPERTQCRLKDREIEQFLDGSGI